MFYFIVVLTKSNIRSSLLKLCRSRDIFKTLFTKFCPLLLFVSIKLIPAVSLDFQMPSFVGNTYLLLLDARNPNFLCTGWAPLSSNFNFKWLFVHCSLGRCLRSPCYGQVIISHNLHFKAAVRREMGISCHVTRRFSIVIGVLLMFF